MLNEANDKLDRSIRKIREELALGDRVRYISNSNPDAEPVGTIVSFYYPNGSPASLCIEWDDEHPNSAVNQDRWYLLERI